MKGKLNMICLAEFEEALSMVSEHLDEEGTKLILLGDYFMELQCRYGSDKVITLMENHEEFVLLGDSTINHMINTFDENLETDDEDDDRYIRWMENLPRYCTEGNTIFVHAGIDEDAGDLGE